MNAFRSYTRHEVAVAAAPGYRAAVSVPIHVAGAGSFYARTDVAYRYRLAARDSWFVAAPWGRIPVDREGLAGFAAYQKQTLEELAASAGLDLARPEIRARTGCGARFYAELSRDGAVLDAYTLGESEDLGFSDTDEHAFYGKASVALCVPDAVPGAYALTLYVPPDTEYFGGVYLTEPRTEPAAELPPEFYARISPPREALEPVILSNEATPCDEGAMPCAATLLSRLKATADAGYLLYGVQNYPYEKGGGGYRDAPRGTSDVFDLVGANPAIFGLDSLSLIGMENAWRVDGADGDFVRGSALRSIAEWRGDSVITLSMHMSDPAMVYDDFMAGNVNRATGKPLRAGDKWEFLGYGYDNSCRTATDAADGRERSPHKPMLRLFRGERGVTEVFDAYLDLVAAFCLRLQAEGVPVLLRPFHENSGDWFWWGNSGCEDEDGAYNPEIFIRNWRYIVEYLRAKGVHNALYVYSPNGDDFDNAQKLGTAAYRPYAATYPGDAYVDVCAFDDYTTSRDTLRADMKYVTDFAAAHGKLAAASEVTGSPTDPAVSEFLFTTLLDSADLAQNLAYMLQWTPPSFAPYLVSPSRANSGAVGAFARAVCDRRIVLAGRWA
ncbi:MAG: glycoside hydrolase family 26 protein [Oscillospiraceae bacterium]|jgi:aryl carrier-like protein|nr:glycoside hydrolase family 26 protein [Oscillospiraceae bacterium]